MKAEKAVETLLTLTDIGKQYGESSPQRQFLFRRLQVVVQLLKETQCLRRLYLFGSFTTVKPAPNDLDCLAVMTQGFSTANLSSPHLDVFQHDVCRLSYQADVFWVTETVGEEHIEAMLAVFSRDRVGNAQAIVEVNI